MRLRGVALLLADATARSKAYAQAFLARGLEPDAVVVFGSGKSRPPEGRTLGPGDFPGMEMMLPDLSIPLEDTVRRLSATIRTTDTPSVNAPGMAELIRTCHPDLVVYSGFGGEIVGPDVLAAAPDFLHAHSGLLPDYRGSTTIYYSLIERGICAVTALLLDEGIDTGTIVMRGEYPPPPPGMDVDTVYDTAIRADLMVKALLEWTREGRFRHPERQRADQGRTYYIIHPLLKHLALLGLESRAGR